MKAIVFAMLAALLLAGCNDPNQTTDAIGGKSGVATTQPDTLDVAARNQKRTLKASDIAAMNKVVEKFYVQEGRFPKDLEEIVERGYLPRLPVLPERTEWDYDTNSGVVGILRD